MTRALLFFSLAFSFHCGSDTRLRQIVACADDLACPAGFVCAEDQSACLEVDSEDIASWTKPTTSDALYERLGGMKLVNPAPGVTQAISFGGATNMVMQPVSSGAVRARVRDGKLELWELQVLASGGMMTIWPSEPGASELNLEVPIRNVELTFPEGLKADLVVGDYPHATAAFTAPLRVLATIGDDANAEVSIATNLDETTIEAALDVVDGRVSTTLHIRADVPRHGNEGWLRVEHLELTVVLTAANEIPQVWLK